jgi:hypothetical protein
MYWYSHEQKTRRRAYSSDLVARCIFISEGLSESRTDAGLTAVAVSTTAAMLLNHDEQGVCPQPWGSMEVERFEVYAPVSGYRCVADMVK